MNCSCDVLRRRKLSGNVGKSSILTFEEMGTLSVRSRPKWSRTRICSGVEVFENDDI